MLRHVVRRNPESGGILQLGLICLNEAPALDVEITLEPLPHSLEVRQAPLPLVVPVISPEAPFFFDFHTLSLVRPPEIAFHVKLKYRDLADRTYQTDLAVDVYKQLGPYFAGRNDFKDLIQAVEKVAAAMQA